MFAVGVGTEITTSELVAIANKPAPAYVLYAEDYTNIDRIRESMEQKLCEGQWGRKYLQHVLDYANSQVCVCVCTVVACVSECVYTMCVCVWEATGPVARPWDMWHGGWIALSRKQMLIFTSLPNTPLSSRKHC